METYKEFLERINSFEKSTLDLGCLDHFKCNPSVAQKVKADNTFKAFFGDTVVFALNDKVKAHLSEYTQSLYNIAPQCFCEKLVPHTFHMTLHDLSNSALLSDVAEELFYNELKIIDKLAVIDKFKTAKIKMSSKYIFNMVNTSLVMGLFPADVNGYKTLTEMYSVFDDVKQLNYPLTPHITLAYYNVNGFDKHSAEILEAAVTRLNDRAPIECELSIADLYYQKFTSMNDYTDIICLGAARR